MTYCNEDNTHVGSFGWDLVKSHGNKKDGWVVKGEERKKSMIKEIWRGKKQEEIPRLPCQVIKEPQFKQ